MSIVTQASVDWLVFGLGVALGWVLNNLYRQASDILSGKDNTYLHEDKSHE